MLAIAFLVDSLMLESTKNKILKISELFNVAFFAIIVGFD